MAPDVNPAQLRASRSAPETDGGPPQVQGPGVYNDFLCVNSFPISPRILDLLVRQNLHDHSSPTSETGHLLQNMY